MKQKLKKQKNSKPILIFAVFFTGIILIILIQIFTASKNKKFNEDKITTNPKPSEKQILISYKNIVKSNYKDLIKGVTGKIDVARSKLSFETNGVVTFITSDKGSFVKKGNILAELDKTDLFLKLQYKQNSLKTSNLELEKAKNILKENQEKAKTGYILEGKIKEYELDVKIKENKVNACQLEIKAAELNIKKAELRAPYDGVVLEKKIELGETVSNNKEAFILLDINNIYADIEINEKKVSKIESGQIIELQTNISKELIKGTIKSIVPAVQGKAMILQARAKIDKSYKTLLPGMFVLGNICIFQKDNAINIPLTTITKEKDSVFVFIFDNKTQRVSKRKISISYISDNDAIVENGIEVGEKIVISTTSPLKDNMKVRT